MACRNSPNEIMAGSFCHPAIKKNQGWFFNVAVAGLFWNAGAMDAEELKLLTENADRLVREAANIQSEKDARLNLVGAIQSLTKCIELIAAELENAK
jgi:hypothetical protein